MAPNDNWISKTVQSGVASAGSMAGGVVDSAGKSVEGAGKGVGNTVNSYASSAGNTASDYGNGIKDWTKADGSRSQTAKNPLGTSSNTYGGKGVVTGAGKGGGGGKAAGSKGTAGNPLGLK